MAQQKSQLNPWILAQFMGSSYGVLEALGVDEIPEDHNPVWEAIAGLSPYSEEAIQELVELGEFSQSEAEMFMETARAGELLAEKLRPILWGGGVAQKTSVLRAYALCQTACLNTLGGPISNGDLGTIRQRWYFSKSARAMGFKFAAQALEQYFITSADVVLVDDVRAHRRALKAGARETRYKNQFGKADEARLKEALGRKPNIHIWPKVGWGRSYSQLQSKILAALVRDGLTYDALWIRDESRLVARYSSIVKDFYGALLLEKEGLFPHFQDFCRAAGIPILMSMSGANAFSGVESVLNDHMRTWEGPYLPTTDNPLHLFVISDHDYYGHVPVQEGAVLQFERYLPMAVETHRVGITPEQLREQDRSPAQAGYEFDYEYNRATREWADEEGVWIGDTCYGIEVEALEPRCYISALIDHLVEAVGDEELRKKLLEMAEPDWYTVHNRVNEEAEKWSEFIRRLKALERWAEEWASIQARKISDWTEDQGEFYVPPDRLEPDSWRNSKSVGETLAQVLEDEAEEIDFDSFKDHVEGKGYTWRPVSGEAANQALAELFLEEFEDEIKDEVIAEIEGHTLVEAILEIYEVLDVYGEAPEF